MDKVLFLFLDQLPYYSKPKNIILKNKVVINFIIVIVWILTAHKQHIKKRLKNENFKSRNKE